jgi:hypothetical protein
LNAKEAREAVRLRPRQVRYQAALRPDSIDYTRPAQPSPILPRCPSQPAAPDATVRCPKRRLKPARSSTFYGIVNDLAQAASGPQQVAIHIDTSCLGKLATGVSRIVTRIVLLTLFLVVMGALAAGSFASRQVEHFTQTMADQAMRAAARPQALAPVEPAPLGNVGWREVTTDAPPADWATFEPVVNLPWALAIARAWPPADAD